MLCKNVVTSDMIIRFILSCSKTALLNQIKGPLKEAGGFMIQGKFDKATSSNTVIFSAIDSFFGEIINNGDTELQAKLKLCITESIGYGIG